MTTQSVAAKSLPVMDLPGLVVPSAAVHRSYLAAVAEAHAEGRWTHLDIGLLAEPWVFAEYVARLRAHSTTPPAGEGSETVLWLVHGTRWLGQVQIRPVLTRAGWGAILTCEVRPSARAEGHGRGLLAAALAVATEWSLEPMMISTDTDALLYSRPLRG